MSSDTDYWVVQEKNSRRDISYHGNRQAALLAAHDLAYNGADLNYLYTESEEVITSPNGQNVRIISRAGEP